jgi:hypothetical protein
MFASVEGFLSRSSASRLTRSLQASTAHNRIPTCDGRNHLAALMLKTKKKEKLVFDILKSRGSERRLRIDIDFHLSRAADNVNISHFLARLAFPSESVIEFYGNTIKGKMRRRQC